MKANLEINRATLRQEMIKEWQALTQIAAQNKSKQSLSRNQICPAVRTVDLSALQALQKTIAAPLHQPVAKASVSQTPGKHTRVASSPVMSSSSPAKTNSNAPFSPASPTSHSRRHRRGESDKTGATPKFDLDSSDTSEELTTRRRAHSALAKDAYPVSPKIISPGAIRKNQLQSVSQSSSSASTSRDTGEIENPKSPGSPRSLNMAKLRRGISKKLPDIDLSQMATNIKAALSPNASPRKSPKEDENNDPLASVPFSERNQLAKKISDLQMTEAFRRKTPLHQTALLHALVSENLTEDSPLYNLAGLNLLIADAKRRCSNASVDAVVNLADAGFLDFVQSAVDGAFAKPWKYDSSDVGGGELKQYLSKIKPTFARDFSNSTYQVRDTDGSLRKLTTIDEFIAYIEGDAKPGMAMVVSNIASQNLGNFLKNVMFLRQGPDKESNSYLRLYDGTPILPQAIAKASYVLEKNKDGSFTIDYTWESSKAINGAKEIRARELGGNGNTFKIDNPSLQITARVRIQSAEKWEIENPHIKAEGWHQTPDH